MKVASFLLITVSAVQAFTIPTGRSAVVSTYSWQLASSTEDAGPPEAVFVPPEDGDQDDDISFEAVESLGRGAAKVRVCQRAEHDEIIVDY